MSGFTDKKTTMGLVPALLVSSIFSGYISNASYSIEQDGYTLSQLEDFAKIEEYLSFVGNNSNYMDDNAINSRTQIENWTVTLNGLIGEDNIEFGEDYQFFDFLNLLRAKNGYEYFLRNIISSGNQNWLKAVLLFLAQKEFKYVYAYEENFVLELLDSGLLELQEFALNTIIAWGKITNMAILKEVKINNYYLQNDLKEFIGEKV